ncbi:MAG: hypothetical protein ACTSUR_02790 [Candidatus Heimdallarchaeaceae archaeon]
MKLEQKQFIRNFNAIREMYGIDIVEEENLVKLLQQLEDTMVYTQKNESKSKLNVYAEHKINDQLRFERAESFKAIMFHKGTLL